MSTFPLVINFEGDYGMKVIMVDPGKTMAEVAQIAADQLVGVVVKQLPPNTKLAVRRHGEVEPLSDSLRVADAGFVRMETIDIYKA